MTNFQNVHYSTYKTEEADLTAVALAETKSSDHFAHYDHSDRINKYQGLERRSYSARAFWRTILEGSYRATATAKGQLWSRKATWNSSWSLAQVRTRGQPTLQRLGTGIQWRTISISWHSVKCNVLAIHSFIYLFIVCLHTLVLLTKINIVLFFIKYVLIIATLSKTWYNITANNRHIIRHVIVISANCQARTYHIYAFLTLDLNAHVIAILIIIE